MLFLRKSASFNPPGSPSMFHGEDYSVIHWKPLPHPGFPLPPLRW